MTILDDVSTTTDKASSTLVDHGHHIVDLGVEQAKAKADQMRKAANKAAKQAERKTRKAAKKARRRSAAMWSDFADEAAARASTVLPVTKKRSKTPIVLGIVGLGAGAYVVLRMRKSATPADAPAPYQPPASGSTLNGSQVAAPEARK